ncbi:hypothetical protein EOA35_14395 [Mesorhizobium sp. M8A.F.Ca.ET.023.01.1.1]|nr:hypothetical protein EOA35_14395 [Mesorhizobium sp. M8A.F.Ca.ET.023.01.1.1]
MNDAAGRRVNPTVDFCPEIASDHFDCIGDFRGRERGALRQPKKNETAARGRRIPLTPWGAPALGERRALAAGHGDQSIPAADRNQPV